MPLIKLFTLASTPPSSETVTVIMLNRSFVDNKGSLKSLTTLTEYISGTSLKVAAFSSSTARSFSRHFFFDMTLSGSSPGLLVNCARRTFSSVVEPSTFARPRICQQYASTLYSITMSALFAFWYLTC